MLHLMLQIDQRDRAIPERREFHKQASCCARPNLQFDLNDDLQIFIEPSVECDLLIDKCARLVNAVKELKVLRTIVGVPACGMCLTTLQRNTSSAVRFEH